MCYVTEKLNITVSFKLSTELVQLGFNVYRYSNTLKVMIDNSVQFFVPN